MTKKDYERAAEMVRCEYPHGINSDSVAEGSCGQQAIVTFLAEFFAGDNSRFDRDRFIQACQPKERRK